MPADLETIYDTAFFREWGRHHEAYVRSAERIADILYAHFRPATMIDWGCGCGVYAQRFQHHGVSVRAVDGVIPPADESFPVAIEQFDLTRPIHEDWPHHDLSICFEVGEHIHPALRDAFLANITRYCDTLLLSCAPPRQGGHHHVNEQPKRYWIEALSRFAFRYNRFETGKIIETFKRQKPRIDYAWMFEQISVYERSTSIKVP